MSWEKEGWKRQSLPSVGNGVRGNGRSQQVSFYRAGNETEGTGFQKQQERYGSAPSGLVLRGTALGLAGVAHLGSVLGQNKKQGKEGQKGTMCGIHRRWEQGWGREGCHRCSIAVLWMRLGDWIWRGGGSSQGLQLASLFCLAGVFPVNASWCWSWHKQDELGDGKLGKKIFVICWAWGKRCKRDQSRFPAINLGIGVGLLKLKAHPQ